MEHVAESRSQKHFWKQYCLGTELKIKAKNQGGWGEVQCIQ